MLWNNEKYFDAAKCFWFWSSIDVAHTSLDIGFIALIETN